MAFVDCDEMTCAAKCDCTRETADAAAYDDDGELDDHFCLDIPLVAL